MVGREGVAPPQHMAAALQAVGLTGAQPTEKDERVVRDGARLLVLDGPMRLSKSVRGSAGRARASPMVILSVVARGRRESNPLDGGFGDRPATSASSPGELLPATLSAVVLRNHQMGWLVPGFPAGIDRGSSATNAGRHVSATRVSRWPSYPLSAFRVHITSASVNPPPRAVKAFSAARSVTLVSPRSLKFVGVGQGASVPSAPW